MLVFPFSLSPRQDARQEGQDPALINLGGFEAAMAGKLREAHTLPVLTKGRDELLFGAAEKDDDRVSFDLSYHRRIGRANFCSQFSSQR